MNELDSRSRANPQIQPGEGSRRLEVVKYDALSRDERHVVEGIALAELRSIFTLSDTTLRACDTIWDSYLAHPNSLGVLRAVERARKYFTKRLESGDESVRANVIHLQEDLETKLEYGQQFYKLGDDVVMGRIVRGGVGNIDLRNNNDGIDDKLCIVNVHSHPMDISFSEKDVVVALSEGVNNPALSLYVVVTESRVHLLHPTVESRKYNAKFLIKKLIEERFDERDRQMDLSLAERDKVHTRFIGDVANEYQLGYYIGPRGSVLERII